MKMINQGEQNLDMDDVLDVITDFPVKPYRQRLIVTTNVVTPGLEEGVDLSDVRFSETQYIVAVGTGLKEETFKPGMRVILDLERMMVQVDADDNTNEKVGFLKLDPVKVGDHVYAFVSDNYIKAIDNRDV